MHLSSYSINGAETLVVRTANGNFVAKDLIDEGPATLNELIRSGEVGLKALREGVASPKGEPLDVSGHMLLSAVPAPPNVVCIGANYASHAGEQDMDKPKVPEMFFKHTSSIHPHGADIRWDPSYTTNIDWEAELAVVISKEARNIPVAAAMDYVFGYTPFNDVTARDIQFHDLQWARGKSLDNFGPCGPQLLTADEVQDPGNLDIRCILNGEVVQESNTALMYYSIAEIISFCSRAFTLKPGDLIATGTPGGVGAFRTPPVFMKGGDTVVVEIDGVGRLENKCAASA